MKIEEAEKLVCPFMSRIEDTHIVMEEGKVISRTLINCITTKCMAWISDYDKLDVTLKENWNRSAIEDAKKSGYCARIGK